MWKGIRLFELLFKFLENPEKDWQKQEQNLPIFWNNAFKK
ncbi:MAG: hypothetical protein H6Q25_1 [Bacteroidetes bacterium]|nr:hypothetical protein [Bacteroidota bacterium]